MFKKIFFLALLSAIIAPTGQILAASSTMLEQAGLVSIKIAPADQALISSPTTLGKTGLISINFDDGLLSTYSLAAPLMAKYGFKGTAYVYPKPQNEKTPEFMSWDNVVALQNSFGWEIGSHGYTHEDLTTMSLNAAKQDIDRSRNDLINHGLKVQSFASPYGAYNDDIVNYVTKNFNSHRTAWNLPNTWHINNYYLKARPVLPTTPVSQVTAWVNEAKANKQWLILYFHALTEGTATEEEDDYNINDFKAILEHIKNAGLPVMTNSAALDSWGSGKNIVANGSFENGTLPNADFWLRSDASGVNVAAGNLGVYPTPARSVVINGAPTQKSISTVEIPINPAKKYRLKSFYRVSNYLAGDSTVWVSEFNANYQYLGGQWLGGLNYNFLGPRYFDYKPGSNAAYAEIFFLTHENAKMKFEIDGVELREF